MSIGEALAGARHQAGLTVAQVSERTRIRQTLIDAIERDDFSGCGGDFYARGHIRGIAKAVGTDPAPLIAEYDAVHRESGPASAASLDELLASARQERRRRPLRPALASLVLVVALGLAGYAFLGGAGRAAHRAPAAERNAAARRASSAARPSPVGALSGSGRAQPSARPTPSPAASSPDTSSAPGAASAGAVLTPARASAFGAGGAGQGDNPGLARLAIDHSAGTAWHTDWYTSPLFGNLYPGTGLLLDMGRPATITAARISLGVAGAAVELRVGPAPTLADLRVVARAAPAGAVASLRPAGPARGRYVLLWFTRLPGDAAGTFQASVYSVSVQGSE